MKYYVIDKVDMKAYGPMDSKRQAQEALQDAIELSRKVMQSIAPDFKFTQTEKLDEIEVSVGSEIVSLYEIITEDQFDDSYDLTD